MPGRHFATSVIQTLSSAGHIAYFAGGWVRDFLMKRSSDDIDIATSASVKDIQSLFPKTIPVGISFGIVIVVIDGHQFEVATFRKDCAYTDGRRPSKIEPATPEEDAQRRDFTINGMFYDPLKHELYDFVGGQRDIDQKIIRAIGDPHERFAEDRLRMMRAVRYATRFNFSIEPATETAISAHANTLLSSVAMERIWQEFKKMSQFAHFGEGLISLHRLHLLPTIFPMLNNVSLSEIKTRLDPLVFYPPDVPPIAELLALFPDASLQQWLDLADYLKLSRQEKDFMTFLHSATALMHMPTDWQNHLEKAEWAHFYAAPYSKMSLEIYAAHLNPQEKGAFLQSHELRQHHLKRAIHQIATQTPTVKASHLMQQGIPPGKHLGHLLREAERISINQEIEDPEVIIALLKKKPFWQSQSSS